MATIEDWEEAQRRGLLSKEQQADFAEAKRRGLVGQKQAPAPVPVPPQLQQQQSTGMEGLDQIHSAATVEDTKAMVRSSMPYLRPTLEFGGMTIGGILGAGSGIVTGPAAPVVTAAGGIGGYSIGRQTADILERWSAETPAPSPALQEAFLSVGKDIKTGVYYETLGPLFGKAVTKWGAPAAQKVWTAVEKNIAKAIKPPKALMKNARMIREYFRMAKSAVMSIVNNKDNLRLTNPKTGEVASGLPKTLVQFTEAIQQTKEMLFAEYNSMVMSAAKTANQQMPSFGKARIVSLNQVVKELQIIAEDRVLKTVMPEFAGYAEKTAQSLAEASAFTPLEAQEAIKMYNQTTREFHLNPKKETYVKAQIDALIANHLRQSLDSSVAALEGAGYKELKTAYGALSHIEQQVAGAAALDLRKAPMGLLDFSDIFSGYQALSGILHGDPARFTAGAGSSFLKNQIKRLNDPNRMVQTLFKDVDRLIAKQITPGPPVSPGGAFVGRGAAYGTTKKEEEEY
jgi:hypothetical protein